MRYFDGLSMLYLAAGWFCLGYFAGYSHLRGNVPLWARLLFVGAGIVFTYAAWRIGK